MTKSEAHHKQTKRKTSKKALHTQIKRVRGLKRHALIKTVTSAKAHQKQNPHPPKIDQKKAAAVVLRINEAHQAKTIQKIEVALQKRKVVIVRENLLVIAGRKIK